MIRDLVPGRAAEILLVEDNADDVLLTCLAFQRLGVPIHVNTVGDGDACLRFLRREAPWAEAPAIDLVLLDLNLPRMDGRATLLAITADDALRHLPVVVLTTSAREEDLVEMYRLRCSGYIVKPVDLTRFFDAIAKLCTYWFGVVRLPRQGH
jgi:CheY-like chemotaxis protein